MNINKQHVSVDSSGTYKPKSVYIAMVGPKRVSTVWAVNALYLQIPTYLHWRVRKCETDTGEDAQARVFQDFEGDPERPDWLFVWPAEQFLEWDALIRAINSESDVVWIGRASCYRRGKATLINKDNVSTIVPIPGASIEYLEDRGTDIAPVAPEVPVSDPRLNPERSFVICVPTLGTASLEWAGSLLALDGPMGANSYLHVLRGYEVGEARDRLVDAVLQMDPRPKYLLFLGDDNTPSPHGVQRLFYVMEQSQLGVRQMRAVSGLYRRKATPAEYVAWRAETCIREDRDFKSGEVVEVDGCGLDFVLLHTEDLEKIPKPRFKTVHTREKTMTEDVWFWRRFYETTGVRPFVDTGNVVGHYEWRAHKTW